MQEIYSIYQTIKKNNQLSIDKTCYNRIHGVKLRTSGDIINPKWMRFFQIVVGIACIGISMFILIGSHELGLYPLIFLSSSAFIIIGIERIVVGIKSTFLKRSSRLISIGIGIGLVIYFGSASFCTSFHQQVICTYVWFWSFGYRSAKNY